MPTSTRCSWSAFCDGLGVEEGGQAAGDEADDEGDDEADPGRGITVKAVAPWATETDTTAADLSDPQARAGLLANSALNKVGEPR